MIGKHMHAKGTGKAGRLFVAVLTAALAAFWGPAAVLAESPENPASASVAAQKPHDGAQTQAQPQSAPAVVPDKQSAPVAAAAGQDQGLTPDKMRSVLFTYWEYTAIKDAKQRRGDVRAPTQEEIDRSQSGDGSADRPLRPEEREVVLNGISYVSDADWTIWLNGIRVTPQALPKEAIDLRVYREYVDVKWHDIHTNKIFPIRLRPYQRFNLDMRVFLPG